jgi:hypothetical protein
VRLSFEIEHNRIGEGYAIGWTRCEPRVWLWQHRQIENQKGNWLVTWLSEGPLFEGLHPPLAQNALLAALGERFPRPRHIFEHRPVVRSRRLLRELPTFIRMLAIF